MYETSSNPCECRHVTCYKCGHRFMELKATGEVKICKYVLVETGEEGFLAQCPMCGQMQLVFSGYEMGMPEDDEMIKQVPCE